MLLLCISNNLDQPALGPEWDVGRGFGLWLHWPMWVSIATSCSDKTSGLYELWSRDLSCEVVLYHRTRKYDNYNNHSIARTIQNFRCNLLFNQLTKIVAHKVNLLPSCYINLQEKIIEKNLYKVCRVYRYQKDSERNNHQWNYGSVDYVPKLVWTRAADDQRRFSVSIRLLNQDRVLILFLY